MKNRKSKYDTTYEPMIFVLWYLPGVFWLPVVGRFVGTSGVPPDENSRPVEISQQQKTIIKIGGY